MANKPPENSPRPASLVRCLAYSFLFAWSGYILDQMFRWTNPLDGFANGLIHFPVVFLTWGIFGFGPTLLIAGLYRICKWRRFRRFALIAPGGAILLYSGINLIVLPPTASGRFERITGVAFPAHVENLTTNFSGGGIADYSDTYSFRSTPSEVDRLIRELGLHRAEKYEREFIGKIPWPSDGYYCVYREEGGWFYQLFTDPAHEQVRMVIGCD